MCAIKREDLDDEWVALILYALEIGIPAEELIAFFREHPKTN